MPAIAVTGGIACGKSTVSLQLVEAIRTRYADVLHFNADACAHRLLRDDISVRSAVLNTFGASILGPDQIISRKALRDIITQRPEKRSELERILHPAIRSAWTRDAQLAHSSSDWFVAEIPLLFETNAAPLFDRIVAVVCSKASQHTRLFDRAWSDMQIREIVIAQAPIESKMLSAHYVIWTDVPMHIVGRQTALLAESLLHTFAE